MRLLVSLLLMATGAQAQCRAVEVSFQPTKYLQIAVWVEDASGNFVDTIYLTRSTGALGLANRPGNARLKSGYRWPYGRRVMVMPVWAHRRNHSYPYIVMGGHAGVDKDDDSIGYHESVSSLEPFYCPPSSTTLDVTSCASAFTGSKGIYQQGMSSLYPPRADLSSFTPLDSDDAHNFAAANDVAAISGATPPGGQVISPPLRWMAPANLPDGTYTIFVEASLEADFNASHHHPTFLDDNTELSMIGHDIFGQPSIVYSVPIVIDSNLRTATNDAYAGYGSWDGSDGNLHPPDATISDTSGSGAGRLAHVTDGDGTWRVKAETTACTCTSAPETGAVSASVNATQVTLSFTAPAKPGAHRYDIRYRPSTPLDDSNFGDGIPADGAPTVGNPGAAQSVQLAGLKGETLYYIGVRTLNPCGEPSLGQFTSATTGKQKFVTLNGCFIATAAYGSDLEPDVELLRKFRDRALLKSPLGQLAVAVYYANSPPLARAISTDERLRALARRAIRPAVALARAWLSLDSAGR